MGPEKSTSFVALLILCASLLSLIAVVSLSLIPLNHDAAVFLQCAQLLLNGNVPYVDYVELNPPLAHYLHVIPVIVANITGISLPAVFQFLVTLLVLWSAFLLFSLLRATDLISSSGGRLLLAAGWILFSLFVYASGSFGQREHLFTLACVPWLFCREARYRNIGIPGNIAWGIGIFAAVTALLKPHFLLVIILAELWMVIRTRRQHLKSAEAKVLGCIVLLYGLHFLFIPSAMRTALFTRWIPFILEHYGVYSNSLRRVLFLDTLARSLLPFAMIASVAGVFFIMRRVSENSRLLIESLCIGVVASFGTYVLQQKGWFYHMIPFLGMTAVMIMVMGIILFEKKQLFPYAALGCVLLSGAAISQRISHVSAPTTERVSALSGFIEQASASTDRVTFISTNVYPSYPALVYAGRLSGTRYLVAFPIAMLYEGEGASDSSVYRTWQNASSEERTFLEELGADVGRNAPQLIFIDASNCQGCPPKFRTDTYLDVIGWKARYLQEYGMVQSFHEFSVYRRRGVHSSEPG